MEPVGEWAATEIQRCGPKDQAGETPRPDFARGAKKHYHVALVCSACFIPAPGSLVALFALGQDQARVSKQSPAKMMPPS